jgi:hypothetical protein
MRVLVALFVLVNLSLLALAMIHLPVHWDDGWNLCAARHWFQDGHFGCKYLGNLTSARLSTGWVPVALARYCMEFVGVTYLASRIAPAAIVVLAMIGLFVLAKAYSKSTNAAFFAVTLACFLSHDLRLNPILLAAQGFSEAVSMALLVWGFLLLHYLLARSQPKNVRQYFNSAALFLGILTLFLFAGKTKEICFYFLIPALFLSGVVFLIAKKPTQGLVLILLAASIYYIHPNFHIFHYPTSSGFVDLAGSSTVGLPEALGVNPDLHLRSRVIKYMAKSYWMFLPLAIYYCVAIFKNAKNQYESLSTLPLFLTCILWSGWFFLLSIDFYRYYSIPAFLFVALSGKPLLSFISLFKGSHSLATSRKPPSVGVSRRSPLIRKALLVIPSTVLTVQLILTPVLLAPFVYSFDTNEELLSFAQEINSRLSTTDSREAPFLETYESQIFYLLDVPYRYPPDQINVEMILATQGRSAVPTYLWNKPTPTCVLVGEWGRGAFGLYGEVANDSRYHLARLGREFKLWCLKKSAINGSE